MRILHLDTEMTWRGGENQIRLLLAGLRSSDLESHVAVRPGSLAAERLSGLAKVHTIPMRGGFDPLAAWRLAEVCRTYAIDLIDAHTSNAHSLGLMTKVLYPKLKLIVHRRVDYLPKTDFVNRCKYLSPHVDAYIAISEAIAKILVEYGVPRAKLHVARSAIDPAVHKVYDHNQEKNALAQAYGLPPEMVFIGNAAAMTDQKGLDVLLRAIAQLKRQLSGDAVKFHCFIAGDGPLRDSLERLRIELDLEYDVTFLGFINEVPRFLSALDILATPSNYEGLGTIILDGIAAGLAVAATQVGGIPEIIKHEVTGLLSPVGDDELLATHLNRLASDPALRARLNQAAQAHIQHEFSLASMVGGNLEVYRQVVGRT